MYSVIKGWCDAYERCCLHKIPAPHTITLTSVHTVRPLELVCLDFLTLERSKGGIENVLVVTDYYTRYAQAYPTPDQRAPTIANVLWKRFICHYGIPERIHTDQGMNFESNLLQQLWKVMGISKSWTTPYHPQGNGTTERFNRTLMNMLGTLEPDQKLNRKEYVEPMTHAYNCTRHESTGFSPFLLMSGRHPRLPVDLALGLPHMEEGVSEYEDYVQQFQDRLAKAYKRATDLSTKAKQKQKYFYDCKAREAPLALGDWVLVANKGQRGKQKLRDKWERAPHVVIKKQGELPVYVVCPETGAGERVLHRNLLTPCMFLPIEGIVNYESEDKVALEPGQEIDSDSLSDIGDVGEDSELSVSEQDSWVETRERVRPPTPLTHSPSTPGTHPQIDPLHVHTESNSDTLIESSHPDTDTVHGDVEQPDPGQPGPTEVSQYSDHPEQSGLVTEFQPEFCRSQRQRKPPNRLSLKAHVQDYDSSKGYSQCQPFKIS
nr:PREDICTED: uncharacterized protein K02A2.6-like [Latimeria chalumnae]|eukprot:XP_014349520.1 PREDICTED: uncharacterized protein K02A2.6-like [Latimeria chalumnae]